MPVVPPHWEAIEEEQAVNNGIICHHYQCRVKWLHIKLISSTRFLQKLCHSTANPRIQEWPLVSLIQYQVPVPLAKKEKASHKRQKHCLK